MNKYEIFYKIHGVKSFKVEKTTILGEDKKLRTRHSVVWLTDCGDIHSFITEEEYDVLLKEMEREKE